MNFYKKIKEKDFKIPESFDIRYNQMIDLKHKATGYFDLTYVAFRFGYMQGVRAERAGKAVL